MRPRARLTQNGRLASFAVGILLCFATLLPQGFMLAPVGAHGISVVLCPETHPLGRAVASNTTVHKGASSHEASHEGTVHDASQHHHSDHDQSDHEGTAFDCPFAVPSLQADGPVKPAAYIAPWKVADLPHTPAGTRVSIRAPARLFPPSRAPPDFV